MNPSTDSTIIDDSAAWNQAHDRLRDFLSTFALGDHAQVSRLTLLLLDQAREQLRQDSSSVPVSVVMARAQELAKKWLSSNLQIRDQSASQIVASGYVAMLLSRTYRSAPDTFLTSVPPEKITESMRRTLLVTGPDLKISSMTPRDLDYGPMLDLARNTWHRWNAREVGFAVLFWIGVYFVFYWWLSEAL
jgi:hypothetical protein